MNATLSIGQCATLACLLEAIAPKPGNVHRGADFEDLTFTDFAASAVAIGPAMEAAAVRGVGETVLAAVRATRKLVATNTNLGTVLLLAPLAVARLDSPDCAAYADAVRATLRSLSPHDTKCVYEAIRLANAGGLGRVDECDIAREPPADLLHAMRLAEGRDRVAWQYTNQFADVFDVVLPSLVDGGRSGLPLSDAIVRTQLELLARYGDSLIARKCGEDLSRQVAARAGSVLEALQQSPDSYEYALSDFDFWLRSDGHRRNPGTTADLIAAGLFAGLRTGLVSPSRN